MATYRVPQRNYWGACPLSPGFGAYYQSSYNARFSHYHIFNAFKLISWQYLYVVFYTHELV